MCFPIPVPVAILNDSLLPPLSCVALVVLGALCVGNSFWLVVVWIACKLSSLQAAE